MNTKPTKRQVIDAIQWMFGYNKKEAEALYKKTDESYHFEIRKAFEDNAARAFYQ